MSATDAVVVSVEVPVDAAPLDCFELLFDETVDVLVFGAAIVAAIVCGGVLRWPPAFRGRVGSMRAIDKGMDDQGRDMAASIAYYTLLSLFPLILGLVSIGGFFLMSEEIQLRVNELIVQLLPVSADLVTRNIDSLVRIRGAAGITSIVVLMWSASKMVGALSRAINRALGLKRTYAVYLSSLRYFVLTVVVASLVFLAMAVAPAVELLSGMQLEWLSTRVNVLLDVIASNGGR